MKWLSVHIGGQLWSVYVVNERSKWLRTEELGVCKGITYFDDCRIYLAREQSAQAFEDTLLHELLHALLRVSGAAHKIGNENDEEDVVRDLTPVLHRLLKDLGFLFPRL